MIAGGRIVRRGFPESRHGAVDGQGARCGSTWIAIVVVSDSRNVKREEKYLQHLLALYAGCQIVVCSPQALFGSS